MRRLSMSELEGTRRGRAEDSVAERREWEEEEVRMDLTEVAEVRETTEDEEEVEERTGPPRDRDCSRRVWVLVGLGETRGLGVGLGDTVSFRNMLGLEGSLGGVLLEGIEEPLAVRLEEQVEAVSEVSSLVKVPCLTRGAAEVEVRGERGDAVRAPDWARQDSPPSAPPSWRWPASAAWPWCPSPCAARSGARRPSAACSTGAWAPRGAGWWLASWVGSRGRGGGLGLL